jgi:hypothetical protein
VKLPRTKKVIALVIVEVPLLNVTSPVHREVENPAAFVVGAKTIN